MKICCQKNIIKTYNNRWACKVCGNVYISYKKGEPFTKQIQDLKRKNHKLKQCLIQLGKDLI